MTMIHEIKYREDKKPLKLAVYYVGGPEGDGYLADIIRFVRTNSNDPQHLAKMEPAKQWALVERLATLFCRANSPTATWSITKPEIRGAVFFVLDAAIAAGEWPRTYQMTDNTFVKLGGGRDE